MGEINEAEMSLAAQADRWLATGGMVVTASERAARALTASYHQMRRHAGLTAWPAPQIEHWQQFVRRLWQERVHDGRLLLAPLQEESLWTAVVGTDSHLATSIESTRARLGKLAMEAHALLCAYAPAQLEERVRLGWQRDQASFSQWLTGFEEHCNKAHLVSAARLPLEVAELLTAENATESADRPALLLVGFDRLQPTQKRLLTTWGAYEHAVPNEPARTLRFYTTQDEASELAAAARWCALELAANPAVRLLLIAQNAARNRGLIERVFRAECLGQFEFSLGIQLAETLLGRGLLLVLGWLTRSIEENALDWLLSTEQTTRDTTEADLLFQRMRVLRRRGLERTQWSHDEFVRAAAQPAAPPAWVERFTAARKLLREQPTKQAPLAWSELLPRLLEALGWPGGRPLSSTEYQAQHRLEQALESCAALGFDGRRLNWSEFLSTLEGVLHKTLFAAESADAPILIAGPTETAGLEADALWFLGATEESWPATAQPHPFIPLGVQRDAGMPHALPRLDWELAHTITERLRCSASEVCFSLPRNRQQVETGPSRLIAQIAGTPQPLPAALTPRTHAEPATELFADRTHPACSAQSAYSGGAALLTRQSQCPFKAFATTRLAAEPWQPAEPSLNAMQRGNLLHAVLHSIWAGPPHGLQSHADLIARNDLEGFVADHVARTFAATLPPAAGQMPHRYLELEKQRLVRLVTQWLHYEAERIPFTVKATEKDATASVAGLQLRLRLDRVDVLEDHSLLVVDYKTGEVTPRSWDLPRLDDVQLPLYASYGLDREHNEELGGVVFAKVRTGACEFAGRVGSAKELLHSRLSASSHLMKRPLDAEMLMDWRDEIEKLAEEFLSGRASVQPLDPDKTCERCDLQTLCRIEENRDLLREEESCSNEEEAHD
ncbi:PD-(D/E)XK nuclease family protein [Telmatobacter bradus]|uniref:PD-(D/E)XK nuclease family protein n=1 Tax=Telmatobacter bradus TaxID=474953 RepID=UPI003B42D87F